MLEKCIDIDHRVKQLNKFIEKYLDSVKDLPKGTKFDFKFCEKDWHTIIGGPSAADAKKKNLRDKLDIFHLAFLDLNKKDREAFIDIYKGTNNIDSLFKNPGTAKRLSDYPEPIKKVSHELFVHLYEETLSKFNIKNHYMMVFKKMKNSWCPFCGMERFTTFKRFKQDYDHLLAKSIYPVASVNMHNLAPMGILCNRIHKKTKDILLKDNGANRRATNPYKENILPHISLAGSTLDHDPKNRKWKVSISPRQEEIETWDSLFNITARCLEDFLEKLEDSTQQPEFDSFVKMFTDMSKDRRLLEGNGDWDIDRLKLELKIFRNGFNTNYYQESNYLKYAAFDFILTSTDPSVDNFRESLLRTINAK